MWVPLALSVGIGMVSVVWFLNTLMFVWFRDSAILALVSACVLSCLGIEVVLWECLAFACFFESWSHWLLGISISCILLASKNDFFA